MTIVVGERSADKEMPPSRIELYLRKITGEDVTLPEPQSRTDLLLAALLDEDAPLPEPDPNSRSELLLVKWIEIQRGGASRG